MICQRLFAFGGGGNWDAFTLGFYPAFTLGFLLFSTSRDAFGLFSSLTGVGTYLLKGNFFVVGLSKQSLFNILGTDFVGVLLREMWTMGIWFWGSGWLVLIAMTVMTWLKGNRYLSWECKNKLISTLYFKDLNTYIEVFIIVLSLHQDTNMSVVVIYQRIISHALRNRKNTYLNIKQSIFLLHSMPEGTPLF